LIFKWCFTLHDVNCFTASYYGIQRYECNKENAKQNMYVFIIMFKPLHSILAVKWEYILFSCEKEKECEYVKRWWINKLVYVFMWNVHEISLFDI
jgi:hypothetical protein